MRTKLTTMFLALALALTTITSAAALPSEQGNSAAGDGSAITVQSNEDNEVSTQATNDVYEVALSWDDPTFNYNLTTPVEKSWNTETHRYEFPADMSFDGSWNKTSVTATVTNKSTTPMKVSSGLYSAADSITSVNSYKLCSTSDLAVSLSGGDESLVKGSEAKDITCSLSGSDVSSYFAETGAITAVTGQWVIEFAPQVPVLAAGSSWYKGSIGKETVTSITLLDSYTPTGNETESWDASAAGDGSVMSYLNGTDLILTGNGAGKIVANEDSSLTFAGFTAVTDFNALSLLDTSNVTKFGTMTRVGNTMVTLGIFSNCKSVTSLDLSAFDTAKATDMRSMFFNCSKLAELDLTSFNTSNVTSMDGMFSGDESLTTLKISGFDTSNVNSMSGMFYNCGVLTNLDVSRFDTSKVTNMYYMFGNCKALTSLDVSNFNTSSATTMRGMFAFCQNLGSLDVSGFNTSSTTDMGHMFEGCSALTSLNVSGFDTAKVKDMRWMFGDCVALGTLDISSFNTANVTDMGYMFNGDKALTSLNVSNFDTSKVTDMQWMFSGCSLLRNLDVSNWNTSSVTNMNSAFLNCSALTSLNVAGWNTSSVKNMDSMFGGCGALTNLNLSGWDTSAVTNLTTMFENCTALTSLNVSGWNTSNVTNMNTVFHNCSALTSLDLTGWSAAKVTEMNYMFVDCKLLQEVTLDKDFVFVGVDGYLPLPSPTYITGATGKWYDTTSGTGYTPAELAAVTRTGTVTYTAVLPTPVMKSTSSWANGLADKTSVTKITLLDKYTVTGAETASWDASENNDGSVKCYVVGEELIISGNGKGTIKASVDATGMFMGFTNVTEISNLPLLDTSDTKKMSSFFSGCSHLRKLDLSGMNTRKACDSDNRNVYVDYFFHGCTRLETLILGSDVYFGKSYGGIANDFIPAPSPFFVESANGYFYNTSTGESVSNNSLLYWSSNTTVTLSAKPLTAPTGNPVLRTENGSWFRLSGGKNHTIENSKITKITFVNKYTPSAVDYADYEVWDASANNDMSTFCVRIGTEIIIAGNGTGKIKAQSSCGGMFYGSYSSKLGFSGLKEVAGLSVLDTSDVTYMGNMFGECSALTRVDVSSFNMSKVTGLSQMFYRCSSLTSVDCSGWDVSKVTATSYMFSGCTNLRSINLSGWNPVSLGSMAGMFYNCSNVESLDLSKFSTDKITNVYSMRSIFDGMNNLRTVTLGPSFNKFKFYSYGQYVTCYLPAPSATYISGADGKWYDTNTRVGYTPDQFDGMTRSAAVTYVAVMDPSPYMASGSSWWRYSDSNMKGYVNAIEFATSYTPSGAVTAQWSGDEDNRGVYKCYLVPTSGTITYNGTTKTAQKLIIASTNGGKIKLNADSDSFLGTGYWGNVKTLTGLSNLDTSAVTQMGSFFGTMTGYTNALDLRNWNVSNVTNMDTMFYNVSASSINIRGWNVSNLRSAFAMFGQCKNVKTIYLGNFNVPSSCDLTYMFNSTNTGTYGRTGPTVYVASASIKSTIVNLAGLTENTSSNWNSDLNPSQIVVNATAGQSATSQVMALVFGDNEDIVGYNVTNGETVEAFAEVG